MRNKTLGAAIATALAMGISNANAAELRLISPQTENVTGCVAATNEDPAPDIAQVQSCSAATMASQIFPSTGDGPEVPSGLPFWVVYDMQPPAALDAPFKVTFTLAGATWGVDGFALSGGDVSVDNTRGTVGTNDVSIGISDGGGEDDSIIEFFLTPAGGVDVIDTALDFMELKFVIDKANVLASNGKVTLTVETKTPTGISIDGPKTITLISATSGGNLTVTAAAGEAYIDVSKESKEFLENGNNTKVISLGTVGVSTIPTPPLDDTAVTGSDWTFGTSAPTPSSATLEIQNGIFAASLDGPAGPGRVFLDINGSGAYEDTADFAATASNVTATSAKWTFDTTPAIPESIDNLQPPIEVLVEVNGTTIITENDDPPMATLQVVYSTKTETVSNRLRHIKRNGSLCTLYNVPNVDANDLGVVRLTNRSAREGEVRGSLRDATGNYLFEDADLLGGTKIQPNETVAVWVRQPNGDLGVIGTLVPTWNSGRGVLTVSSDLSDMEVYGLVRNKLGGPLMNMSKGATGNGCD